MQATYLTLLEELAKPETERVYYNPMTNKRLVEA